MNEPKKPASAKRVAVTVAEEQPDAATDAKPLIVSRPMLKTPQTAPLLNEATTETTTDSLSNGTASLKAGGKPALKSSLSPAITTTTTDEPAATKETSITSPEAVKPADQPEAETPAATVPAASPAESATPATPSDADKPETDEEQSTTPTEEELTAEAAARAKHDESIQKLVDGKQYFLPINAVEKRKTKHFVILGVVLSLLLLLAWGDIALDAGLIQISGLKPVTHFFSN